MPNRVLLLLAAWAGVLALTRSAPAAPPAALLVEAESFRDKGGWVVDQQFTDTVGSPYLLAHGLGRPVAPATKTLAVPAAGVYRAWVRTRNWAPGDWEAPGRFRVKVNGQRLAPEFGAEPGWAWQDGGSVELAAGTATLALEDLTGFDGRCDALCFTPASAPPPPAEAAALRAWRRVQLGQPATPPSAGAFDAVIVGGGIAGCAAALAAGEQGLRVALVHDRPILGGNASGEVRVHTLGITGKADAILKQINTRHWPNGSPEALADDRKRHAAMESAKGVTLFLKWRATDAVTREGRITAVHAEHTETGETRAFAAPVFIDCTGDGWIGFWAGAEHRYGREARDEFGEGWEKHGNLWAPEKPDQRVMGCSLLWYAKPADAPAPFPELPWARDVAKEHVAVAGEWFWEYSSDNLDLRRDGEAVRDHLLRAIYGTFANARRKAEYARHQLEFVGYILGKRESRRLMGDYVYTQQDATEGRDFPDAVVEETRDIDVHYQRQYGSPDYPYDFLSTALFMKVPRYRIPYRALYSRNVGNLLMAGRCFSCSHIGLGGPRVMNTCGQMGVAVGYAAYLCRRHDTTPRGVYENHLPELLNLVRGGGSATPAAPAPATVTKP